MKVDSCKLGFRQTSSLQKTLISKLERLAQHVLRFVICFRT